jgi:hypothetical protein
MIRQFQKAVLQPLFTTAAVLLMAAGIARTAHAGDYSKSFTVGVRPTVQVDSNDGSVNVVTSADAKEVEFHVDYSGYEIDKNLRIESQQSGNTVTLTARIIGTWHFTLGNLRQLRIEVRMPATAELRVQTGDGAIKVAKLNGSVDLHTGDGGIDVNDVDGKISAVSGDGHISIDGRFDVLQARSADGRIRVRALKGSKLESGWNVNSGDGSIEVAIPNDLSADLDADSGDGRVTSEVPLTIHGTISKSRVHGKLNGGGQTLTIHTGDGAVRLIPS